MRILFMGSPDFARASLESLFKKGKNIVAVLSRPDKPKGRGYILTPTPVKEFALQKNIPVYTPKSLKDNAILPLLDELRPDCIVVVAYGMILPEYVLSYPKYGCINVHASLLPKYRGAAPINFAIINGEKQSGVTTMLMDKGIDTGDMLLKSEVEINESDNAETLHDKLAILGAELIVKTLDELENGNLKPIKQEGESSYAPLINNETRLIDFNMPSKDIINKIRGLSPVPSAYVENNVKIIKIFEAVHVLGSFEGKPGTLVSENKLIIKTADSAVEIKSLMPEAKKKMSGEDFVRGLKNKNNFGFFGKDTKV